MNVLGGILADLRERRLLPVAVALAVALVAVPLLLLKSEDAGSETGSPAATTSASGAGGPPLVALATLHASSNLDTFDSENPFDSPQPIPELTPTEELSPTPSSSGSPTGGSSAGSGGSSGGSGGSVGGIELPPTIPDTPATPSPPSGDGDDRTDSNDNGNGGNGDNGDDRTVTKTVYTHQVDLAFGAPRQLRAFRDIPRLSMLPSALDPMLVFLGVNTSATKAVFLVDARLTGSGEGKCRDAGCAFLELGVGNVHGFTDQDGKRYVLRLDQIRKVEVRAASSGAPLPSAEQDDKAADGDDQQGPAAAGSVVRRFMSPLFGDQVEVEVQQ